MQASAFWNAFVDYLGSGFYLDSVSWTIVGVLAVVALLGLVLRSIPQLKIALPVWLVSGLVGVMLGVGVGLSIMQSSGWRLQDRPGPATTASGPTSMPAAGGMGGGPPGGSGGGMGMMGMMVGGGPPGGMMGGGPPGGMMGGGGPGGGGGQRAAGELTALVGKLDLATRGVHVALNSEQTKQLNDVLAKLADAEKLSNADAEKHVKTIEGLLTAEQKRALDEFALPRPRGAGGGPPGGAQQGSAGYPGAGEAPPPDSPFKQEANSKRLKSLRERLLPAKSAAATKN
jgi:hypothetical protein